LQGLSKGGKSACAGKRDSLKISTTDHVEAPGHSGERADHNQILKTNTTENADLGKKVQSGQEKKEPTKQMRMGKTFRGTGGLPRPNIRGGSHRFPHLLGYSASRVVGGYTKSGPQEIPDLTGLRVWA